MKSILQCIQESKLMNESTSLQILNEIADKADYLSKITKQTMNSIVIMDIKNIIDRLTQLSKELK